MTSSAASIMLQPTGMYTNQARNSRLEVTPGPS